MAWPLYPIGKTQLVYASVGPAFEQLAADTLADHATGKDGFDDVFNQAALSLPAEEGEIAAFTPDLLDMGFETGKFEGSNLLPLAKDTADFTGAGDPLAQGVDNSVTTPPPPSQNGGTTGHADASAQYPGGGTGGQWEGIIIGK